MDIKDYKQKLLDQLSLEQLQQLVSLEESLRKLNKENIVKDQIPYIGKDGREYYSYNELISADEKYFQTHFPYIGEDGKQYATMGELVGANTRYWNSMRIIKNIENINDINKIPEKISPIVTNFRQPEAAIVDYQMSMSDSQRVEDMIRKMTSPQAADFSQSQAARADYQMPMSDSQRVEDMIRKMTSPQAADFSQSQAARADYQMPMSDSQRIISPDAADEQSIKKR